MHCDAILDIGFDMINLNVFVNSILHYYRKHLYSKFANFLIVIEYSLVRGLHANINLLNSTFIKDSVLDKLIEELPTIINIQKNPLDNDEFLKAKIILSYERIKSSGSFLNYLNKSVITVISNSFNHVRAFNFFDRIHIFPADSIPKRQKRNTTK